MKHAPATFRATRVDTTAQVEQALIWTSNLTRITPDVLRQHPSIFPILRMITAPPLARDRLIGLAGVSGHLVKHIEERHGMPPRMPLDELDASLTKIAAVILRLVDRDLIPWLDESAIPSAAAIHRSASVVADRLCGAETNPIIRNAQEQRQLAIIKRWLEARDYTGIPSGTGMKYNQMTPGSFSFHLNVPGKQQNTNGDVKAVNIPVDAVIMPKTATPGTLPVLVEAKSAGDFTNTNKRRKEEATKVAQLRLQHGATIQFVLFLCGYFDSGYLGYEAAEGIDWVWEHRVDDLAQFAI